MLSKLEFEMPIKNSFIHFLDFIVSVWVILMKNLVNNFLNLNIKRKPFYEFLITKYVFDFLRFWQNSLTL